LKILYRIENILPWKKWKWKIRGLNKVRFNNFLSSESLISKHHKTIEHPISEPKRLSKKSYYSTIKISQKPLLSLKEIIYLSKSDCKTIVWRHSPFIPRQKLFEPSLPFKTLSTERVSFFHWCWVYQKNVPNKS
jgi:hypothetical protein